MRRSLLALLAVVAVVVVVPGAGACDIFYGTAPVTAAENTGIFKGIVTSGETNDTACSSDRATSFT